jgi:hypothetical protein
MKYYLSAVIMIIACSISTQSVGATVANQCSKLSSEYDFQDRQIALTEAEGLVDDSAPRATVREMENLNRRQQKMTLVEIMRGQNCPLPSSVDGDAQYLPEAMACRIASARGQAEGTECKISNWTGAEQKSKLNILGPSASRGAPAFSDKPASSANDSPAPPQSSGNSRVSGFGHADCQPIGSCTETGIGTVMPTPAYKATDLKFPKSGGLWVLSTLETTGLMTNDIILTGNGKHWDTVDQMEAVVLQLRIGDPLTFTVWRAGAEKTFTAKFFWSP